MSEDRQARAAGVSPAWRTAALGLTAGLVAYAVLHHGRPTPVIVLLPEPTQQFSPAPAVPDPLTDREVEGVDFNQTPFRHALDRFGAEHALRVSVDWQQLADAGVHDFATVTLHSGRTTVGTALSAILATVGQTVPLGWVDRDGVLMVSTQPGLVEASVSVRVYDVRPLLARAAGDDAVFGPAAQPNVGWYSGPGIVPSSMEAVRVGQLLDLIRSTIDPNSWQENGGTVGQVTCFDRKLTVRQSERGHQQLARFLEMLRSKS